MIPRLRKDPEKKSCHGQNWIDEYSWIHQDNCLEILQDTSKLNPEVRKYLESENQYTKEKMNFYFFYFFLSVEPILFYLL